MPAMTPTNIAVALLYVMFFVHVSFSPAMESTPTVVRGSGEAEATTAATAAATAATAAAAAATAAAKVATAATTTTHAATTTTHAAKPEVKGVTLEEVQAVWTAAWKKPVTFAKNASNPQLLPHFQFMLPVDDVDTRQPLGMGALEPFVTHNLAKHLKQCCAAGGHFTDVGGNYGWFAMQAAAMGCSVDSFEPVAHYAMLMDYNLFTVNNFDRERVVVHRGIVIGADNGRTVSMRSMNTAMRGMVRVSTTVEDSDTDIARTATLDSLLDTLVKPGRKECGFKVDVEGFEPFVMQGAKRFLDATAPQSIIIENSPALTKVQVGDNREAGLRMLGAMLEDLVVARQYDTNRFHWGIIKNNNTQFHLTKTMHEMREAQTQVTGEARNLTQYADCGYNCMMYLSKDGFGATLYP